MERVTPLIYWPVADKSMAVFLASDFGSPKHPAWYHNLRANPLTTVEVGGQVLEVRARWPARGNVRCSCVRSWPRRLP